MDSLLSTPSSTVRGSKFRYIIHGVPKNKKYTIEEAKWSEDKQQFSAEMIHVVSLNTLKNLVGYLPSSIGEVKTVMWIFLPETVYSLNNSNSPLTMWRENHEIFAPYSFDKLRVFPNQFNNDVTSQANNLLIK